MRSSFKWGTGPQKAIFQPWVHHRPQVGGRLAIERGSLAEESATLASLAPGIPKIEVGALAVKINSLEELKPILEIQSASAAFAGAKNNL